MADTVALEGVGGAVRVPAFRTRRRSTGTDTVYRNRAELEYRIGPGDRVEIGSFAPCPINASCTGNDAGTFRGDRRGMVLKQFGTGPRLDFTRLAD